MSIPSLAIRRPVFAWMLMFALIIFGAISFQRLGMSQMPDVDFPVAGTIFADRFRSPETRQGTAVAASAAQTDGGCFET